MALLEILKFPDPRLRTKAKPVVKITSQLSRLADHMLETMYAAPGIGLSASQVNVHQRLIVVDVSAEKNNPHVFFNPQLVATEGVLETNEGCLSVPGFYGPVPRCQSIRVQALNQQNKAYTLAAEDLLAVCIQHEMDHLDGKLFVDYLSHTKRQLIRCKLLKQQKSNRYSRRT